MGAVIPLEKRGEKKGKRNTLFLRTPTRPGGLGRVVLPGEKKDTEGGPLFFWGKEEKDRLSSSGWVLRSPGRRAMGEKFVQGRGGLRKTII